MVLSNVSFTAPRTGEASPPETESIHVPSCATLTGGKRKKRKKRKRPLSEWSFIGPAGGKEDIVARARKVFESCVLFDKRHAGRSGRAVSLFSDDQFGSPFRGVAVFVLFDTEHLGAMDKDHHISVLLNGARFPKIGEHGAFVAACLHGPVELGEGNNRNVQLLGERFE